MHKKLLAIRMSVMAWILFFFFLIVISVIHQRKLTPGQLALFSVNSFLFGYYFGPLLAAQKSRVAALIGASRQEGTTILDILTQSHLLSAKERHGLKIRLKVYLESIVGNADVKADNPYYNELLYYSKRANGEDAQVMNLIYDRIAKTQVNRDAMNNLFATRIYSHEWLVVLVLYGFTVYFALQTDFGHSTFFGLMLAILCTGLSMLMIILLKFATLTHKEAKRMWTPLRELDNEHFEDVTAEEVRAERTRIDSYVLAQKSAR